jgi:hypothetical protein
MFDENKSCQFIGITLLYFKQDIKTPNLQPQLILLTNLYLSPKRNQLTIISDKYCRLAIAM